MPVRITLAQDASSIEQVFRLRHKVFCEEENFMEPNASQRIFDRFDAFPTSKLFVALDDAGQVVGSVRATLDAAVGLPADEYFDFRAHAPQARRLMSVSLYCIAQQHRSAMVASGLMLMCGYFAMLHDVDYVCMPINPTIRHMVGRIGGKPLTQTLQTASHLNCEFAPYLLKIAEMNDAFMHFAKQNVTHNMIRSYECRIFKKGELILRKGDRADNAYLMIDGAAQVLDPHTSQPMAEVTEGDVLGMQDLHNVDSRSPADVRATSLVRAMVLPRAALLSHFRANGDSRPDAVDGIKPGMLQTGTG